MISLSILSRWRRGRPSARKILLDARDAQFGEPLAPTPHRVDLHAEQGGDLLVRFSLGGPQNHLGALRLPHCDLAPSGPSLKGRPLILGEMDL